MRLAGHALSGAVFSDCELYRYQLWRAWDPGRPRLLFVMLNPSTADESILDPTVSRCVHRAGAMGFGSCEVANIFALRSTDPDGLLEVTDPVGPGNDAAILDAAQRAAKVIVAWGWQSRAALRRIIEPRARAVDGLLRNAGHEPQALAVTKDGWPRHPLYLRHELSPQPWMAP